jgi:hypothetical protein
MGHQDLAAQRALPDGMVKCVGEPDRVIGTHRDCVGVGEGLLVAPATEKLSITAHHDDRTLAPVEQVDATLRIDAHARHIVGPTVGQSGPVLDDLVQVVAATSLHWHIQVLSQDCFAGVVDPVYAAYCRIHQVARV